MKQSKLFTKTLKDAPKDEVSQNAQILIRGGFIDKLTAGVYTYLPLGLQVLHKIQNIVREEMNKIDGQEILMPALTPKEIWETTGRWDGLDVLFKLTGAGDKEYALGATHEEVVTPLVQKFVKSYQNLPVAVYQIQDKFRNEPRAKSGILRGREFNMKDLYSFHCDEHDLELYYEKSKIAYQNVYRRCGLDALLVEASGGTFSKFSHEFQVLTEFGEDDIYFCSNCGRHQNKELVENGDLKCPYCSAEREVKKAVEVGNIFLLKNKYSSAFNFKFMDEDGQEKDVMMGCYGIGLSRLMGSVVEVHHDEAGAIWPETIAPYQVHLISLAKTDEEIKSAETIYQTLLQSGIEVLYDDRFDVRAGEKFADSDLIGIPTRLVVSAKTLAVDSVEVKKRGEKESELVKIGEISKKILDIKY